METRRLSYFLRIAEDGSLTRSAEVLRVAQPALSRQMRLLEEELGLKLFRRSARGMVLTEEGIGLRDAIAGPMRELELGIERARTASHKTLSNIAIGVPAGLTAIMASPLAVQLARTASASRIVEGPNGSLVDWLARGMIDLAILEEPVGDHRLVETLVCELDLALVGRADDPLMAENAPIAFADVVQLPLILSSHHMGMRPIIDAAAVRIGAQLQVRFHADSSRLMCDLVSDGIGYGIMPLCRAIALDTLLPLSLRAICAPRLPLRISIAARRMRSEDGIVAYVERGVLHFLRSLF